MFWTHQNTEVTEPYVLRAMCHIEFLLEDIRAGLPGKKQSRLFYHQEAGSGSSLIPSQVLPSQVHPLGMLQNQLPSQDLQREPGRAGLLEFPVCLPPGTHREEFTGGVKFSHQRQLVLLYLEIYQLISRLKIESSWETTRKSPSWQAWYLFTPPKQLNTKFTVSP